MAILVESGRAAVATAIKTQPIHLAWGEGDVAWDASPEQEQTSTTALMNELGRRKVTQTMYCEPNSEGEIIVSQGRFSVSATPTKYLYMRFAFEFSDAAQSTIRELGVFIGTKAKSSASDTDYLLPDDIDEPGQLLVLEYIDKLVRSQQIRQQFEFVIQF